jgi:hypothetical protein
MRQDTKSCVLNVEYKTAAEGMYRKITEIIER